MKKTFRPLALVIVMLVLVFTLLLRECRNELILFPLGRGDLEYAPVWSPDGNKIAFIGATRSQEQIYVMNTSGSNITSLTSIEGFNDYGRSLTWLPDGSRIGFFKGPTFYLIDPDGSNLEQLPFLGRTGAANENVVWSPDGTHIAFTQSELYVMHSDGSNVVQLTDELFIGPSPTWSPDGSQIAFSMDHDIYVINVDGSGLTQLTGKSPDCDLFALTHAFC